MKIFLMDRKRGCQQSAGTLSGLGLGLLDGHLVLYLLHTNPLRIKNGVEHPFIGLTEKVHRPPEHPKMPRLQVSHQVLKGIPFFKKKESIFILDTLAEVAAPASLLHPYGTGQ